jgi:hypothetical protein
MSNRFIKTGNIVINYNNITFVLHETTTSTTIYFLGSSKSITLYDGCASKFKKFLELGNTMTDLDNLFGGEG